MPRRRFAIGTQESQKQITGLVKGVLASFDCTEHIDTNTSVVVELHILKGAQWLPYGSAVRAGTADTTFSTSAVAFDFQFAEENPLVRVRYTVIGGEVRMEINEIQWQSA